MPFLLVQHLFLLKKRQPAAKLKETCWLAALGNSRMSHRKKGGSNGWMRRCLSSIYLSTPTLKIWKNQPKATWVFPKIVVKPPKWMVKIIENPIKMDDLGCFPPIFGNTHFSITKKEFSTLQVVKCLATKKMGLEVWKLRFFSIWALYRNALLVGL